MSGRGRRKVQGGLSHSRKNFPCEVEKCDKTLRSDKLLDHYRSMVCFKANGEPVSKFSDEFAKLCDLKKAHTMFFIDHKYTLTKLPSVKSVTPSQSPTNPFDAAKANARKKQRLNERKLKKVSTRLQIINICYM